MESCNTCHKSPPDVQLKRCTRCLTTQYCSRDCQKVDWKAHKKICGKQGDAGASTNSPSNSNASPPGGLDSPVVKPFTRLDNGTWLHDRPELDVYRLLIDTYRMRIEDAYVFDLENTEGSIYAGARHSLVGFRRFLKHIESSHRPLLPSWWEAEKRYACERLGMDASQWCDLRCAVEKSDVIEHYGDKLFPMQLRMFAEFVYGRVPGGSKGKSMRKQMIMREQAEEPVVCCDFDVSFQLHPARR